MGGSDIDRYRGSACAKLFGQGEVFFLVAGLRRSQQREGIRSKPSEVLQHAHAQFGLVHSTAGLWPQSLVGLRSVGISDGSRE